MKPAIYIFMTMLLASQSALATKMLRFPDIHGDKVVFSYAGDLWLAKQDGSENARRLTSHPGIELFPKFSPDGTKIAFTGQYQGDDQIYVISLNGGEPKQLTYYPTKGPLPARWGTDHQVYDWTPDGKQVVFRSMRSDFENGRLYTVSVDGGLPSVLPMNRAGSGVFSPDGTQIAYSPLIRDFRTWKRYRGGWAQNLFIYDSTTNEAKQFTFDEGTERDPVWLETGIFYVSDQDGTLELFGYDLDTNTHTQLTQNDMGDIKWANGDGKSKIVYEFEAELVVFDTETKQAKELDIHVPDDQVRKQAKRIDAGKTIEDGSLSPDGNRILFSARGGVFSVPVEHGVTRLLTPKEVAHNRAAVWSPNGQYVAYISDVSGEEAVYIVPAQGGEPKRLSKTIPARLNHLVWSPDSQWIAFYDNRGYLYVVNQQGEQTTVVHNKLSPPDDYTWAPDSKWLAYSNATENEYSKLIIWSLDSKKAQAVSDEMFNSYNPQFNHDGSLLYFLSDREFSPQIGYFEWNYAGAKPTGIFALALTDSAKNPFAPRNDVVSVSSEEKKNDKKGKKDKKADKKVAVKIDFDGISQRIVRVPVSADFISDLYVTETHLAYNTNPPFYYGRDTGGQNLQLFDLKERKSDALLADIHGVSFSANGKFALVKSGSGFQRIELAKGGAEGKKAKKINTGNMIIHRAPRDEWVVIFDEVWRRFRDYFYVRNMHGYDWEALRERYKPWVEHVSTREDLNYLMGEMIAELNAGHAYVQGGDLQGTRRSKTDLLGITFIADEKSGRYKIDTVYQGHNAEPKYRSPATEVGARLKSGEYILAIDGEDLTTAVNPYALLTNRGNQPVEVTVSSTDKVKDARTLLIDPLRSESNLVYLAHIESKRDYVSQQSDGKLGYIHIPDMGGDGIYEFIKWYYPQRRKQGIVIDVRGNGGGNVSSMILQRLWKKPLAYNHWAHSEGKDAYPYGAYIGKLAALVNENSASDGDIFPYFFKKSGLGPLIGKRSWGGVIGITNRGSLLDGGLVFVPEFGMSSATEWIIEGIGVEPDIEVENDPVATKDAQLDRAIAELLQDIEEDTPIYPPRPADPIKTY